MTSSNKCGQGAKGSESLKIVRTLYKSHPYAEHLEVLRDLEVLQHGLLRVLPAVLLVERRHLKVRDFI